MFFKELEVHTLKDIVLDWNHKDSKNPPTYRIHGRERRQLKHERSKVQWSLDRGYGNPRSLTRTIEKINKLLAEPYGMISYQIKEHEL